jgi:hypothetical protein
MTIVKKREKKELWRPFGNDQYTIDAGQNKFGAIQCKEFGTGHQICNPEDEKSQKYHNNDLTLKFKVCSTML